MSVSGMMSTVRGQLGTVEGYNNDTKYGSAYGMNHASWCAMFIWWCGRQAHESTAVGKYSYCPAWVTHWKHVNQWTNSRNELERGQIVFWDWNLNGDANHVETVESVIVNSQGSATGVITIGGNTGPKSDRVYRQHRSFAYLLGAGKPHYSDYATAWVGKDLVKGSHNGAVGKLQHRLVKHNYSIGKSGVDNDFGTSTRAAVVKFQKDVKLTADGVVGSTTWGKLFAA
jgi:peptidoglycan hydrolase-like protein with peptidoglycan-binding domain